MFVFLLLIVPISSLKLAFGSCSGSLGRKNPKIWTSIEAWSPEAFIWLGDAIYADKMGFPLVFRPSSREKWEAKYNAQLAEPSYASLRNSTRILGVWDDHDFGLNDADSTFEHKALARELYLNFIGEPADSPRRTNPGINTAYSFFENGKSLKVILLDNRSFLQRKKRVFFGKEQLAWLASHLDEPADVYLIMNGSQFLSQDCLFSPSEKVYDEDLSAILNMVKNKKGVVLVSGDVHFGEIKAYPCMSETVHEITSSGLTHSAYTQYGIVVSALLNFQRPLTFHVGPRILGINWGSIEVDFSKEVPVISLGLRDTDGNILLEHRYSIDEKLGRYDLCQYSRAKRWGYHLLAMFLTFGLPAQLLATSLLLTLRKYSHSFYLSGYI